MRDVTKSPADPPVAALAALLEQERKLAERLHAQADATRYGFTVQQFACELARSAASRFKNEAPSWSELEEYLGTLHVADFALACACGGGVEAAWDFFVGTYRGYLRTCAAAILKRGGESPEARELADSLFAELYGLAEGRRGAGTLLRYFHGRSSLKTWLRAVLAQRHIDGIRAARRFESLDGEDGAARVADADGRGARMHRAKDSSGPLTAPADPYREEYVGLFCRALREALQKLSAADHRRVRLYYAEEKTLAEIGRSGGEHESSVSRNLERIRRELRAGVEEFLRAGVAGEDGKAHADGVKQAAERGLSEAQIALCFQYATEDAPIDFNLLFPGGGDAPARGDAGRKDA